jgi:hypothetical protein
MFFQNPMGQEFKDSWPIDQQTTWYMPANRNNIAQMISGNTEPYDFSVNNTFTISFAYDPALTGYNTININVAGATPGATMATEVAALLNANPLFSDNFAASVSNYAKGGATPPYKVMIAPTKQRIAFRCYITNAGAEQALRFNYMASVKEMPSYFVRDTIANRFTYVDSKALLVQLDPSNPVDQAVITAAGLNYSVVLTDWQLLNGRSNTHTFDKMTYDGSGRIISIIEYYAGAGVGDMARKTQYTYTGASTSPDQVTIIPYTLTSGDLVTPP